MKKIGLFLIAITTLLASCNTPKDTVKMTVASEKRTAMGVGPMEVLQVKEGDAKDWSFFYSNIEGFTFEEGYEYVLEVKKEKVEAPVPADASSIKYILVKEVSKTKKTSENMLESIPVPAKFQWTAKVVSIEDTTAGRGAAEGQFPIKVLKLEVTALNSAVPFEEGATIHAELIAEPTVVPEVGQEYVFKAKNSHPAHALGIYMLDTDVQDLTK